MHKQIYLKESSIFRKVSLLKIYYQYTNIHNRMDVLKIHKGNSSIIPLDNL